MDHRRTLARAALVAAVLVAVLVRLRLNDLAAFSPHDERIYLAAAAAVVQDGPGDGLQAVLRAYQVDPRLWIYPPPIRYGQHLLGGLACWLGGVRFEALSTLSTIAAAAAVVIAAGLARRIGGTRTALVAVALLSASPLWLHLGRRALADAPYSAFALATAWAFLRAGHPDAPRWTVALAVALAAWQTAMKEGGVLLLGALLLAEAAAALRPPQPWGELPALTRAGLRLGLAGWLAWLGFSLLVESPWAYMRVLLAIRDAGATNEYLVRYQGGPAWHYLVDLTLLSPVLVLVAPAALSHALRLDPRSSPRAALAWSLAALAVAYLVLLVTAGAAGMGYNARYLLPIDAVLRVLIALWLVAWSVQRGGRRNARLVAVCALVVAWVAIEAWVFHRVFLEKVVYDPVTLQLVPALDFVR